MPAGPIPPKEVVRLVKKHKKEGGHDDGKTKSVWFSYSDLLKILVSVTELDDAGKNKRGDGVRVYFAQYSDKYPANLKSKRTILFVPTYNLNGGDVHHDYLDFAEVARLSADIGDPDTDTPLLFDAYNHGELCPQQCNGGYVGNP